jgi:hypothetical protein
MPLPQRQSTLSISSLSSKLDVINTPVKSPSSSMPSELILSPAPSGSSSSLLNKSSPFAPMSSLASASPSLSKPFDHDEELVSASKQRLSRQQHQQQHLGKSPLSSNSVVVSQFGDISSTPVSPNSAAQSSSILELIRALVLESDF